MSNKSIFTSKTTAIISDTHGLLRPQLLEALAGVDLIIHAGDLGPASLLEELEQFAPVIAVRGNCDSPSIFPKVPDFRDFQINAIRFQLLHNLNQFGQFSSKTAQMVIHGHTHRLSLDIGLGNTQFINPGSIGPFRGQLPATALKIDWQDSSPQISELLSISR